MCHNCSHHAAGRGWGPFDRRELHACNLPTSSFEEGAPPNRLKPVLAATYGCLNWLTKTNDHPLAGMAALSPIDLTDRYFL